MHLASKSLEGLAKSRWRVSLALSALFVRACAHLQWLGIWGHLVHLNLTLCLRRLLAPTHHVARPLYGLLVLQPPINFQ
jgi:hypothetical protein